VYVAQLTNFSGDSIYARVFSWGIIASDYFVNALDWFHVFFGFALTQLSGDMAPETKYWAIDNSVLMIYLSAGLIGILAYIAWLVHAVSLLRHRLKVIHSREKMNIEILITVIFMYIVSGAMNANILNIQFMLPILLLLSVYTRLGSGVRKNMVQKI